MWHEFCIHKGMEEKRETYCTNHLANQRTFLAWIRTNLGIMAFGFIVERFSFFTNHIADLLQRAGVESFHRHESLNQTSFILGISIIALGTILSFFAFLKYKWTERQINENTYQSSLFFDLILSFFVVLFGVFLIVYLVLAASPH